MPNNGKSMSNNTNQMNLKKHLEKSRFKLPMIFWFSMLCFAFLLSTIVVYVVSQNEQRVTQAAKISAHGLASFVADYVEKHQLIVKSIASHHQDRILLLSKGAGYPYDLAEVENDVNELFPIDTEFAIINHQGKVVVGSQLDKMGAKCQDLIQGSIHSDTPIIPKVNAHQAADGHFHFDILYPINVANEWAGFWVKLSFKPLERFIVNMNINEYELVISEQFPPYDVLLGWDRPGEKALAIVPVDDVAWQVRAIQREAVFERYIHRIPSSI